MVVVQLTVGNSQPRKLVADDNIERASISTLHQLPEDGADISESENDIDEILQGQLQTVAILDEIRADMKNLKTENYRLNDTVRLQSEIINEQQVVAFRKAMTETEVHCE